ncbi:MAG: sulfatase-like hydrolase/transferase [Polyangiaceae bacterium]
MTRVSRLPRSGPRAPRGAGRLGAAFIAACGAGLVAATLEARWSAAAGARLPDAVGNWLAVSGLVVPLAALIGVAAGLLGLATLSVVESGLAALERTWSERESGTAPALLARLPWLALAVPVILASLAHLALALLASALPAGAVAVSLALGSVLSLRVGFGVAAALGRVAAEATWRPLGAGAALTLSVFLLAAPIAWGVATGSPNGDGDFWGIFGVLARQELDLRALTLALAIALCAYVATFVYSARPWPVAASALAVCALGWGSAERWLIELPQSIAIQRGSALAKLGLQLGRRASDGDGDGSARLFGGGDCDDAHGSVYPGALDVPGNGVDEDCSGRDEPLAAPELEVAHLPSQPAQAIQVAQVAQVAAPEPRAAALPADLNVVLISVDTLRHDLGYTGYPRPITPSIDRLAQHSAVFERSYALASYTGKSVGPLLIGRYPSETHRGWLHFNRFGVEDTFVQERLQRAGIRTLAVQGHWYFTPEYGLGRGFDVLDLSAAPKEHQLEGDRTVNSVELTDAAIRELSRPENLGPRFFMWLHYLDPHADYMPHEGFDFGRKARDLYDSEVAFVDQQIGRLLEFMSQAPGIAGRTAVIVTSDHGESFGDNGMWRHGYEVWEALVRVPLVVHVPGLEPRRVAARRSAIDLAPTVLELFGLPLPAGDDALSGRSLVPDLVAPDPAGVEQRPIFVDMSAGPYNEDRQALIDDDHKIIVATGRLIGIYDLQADPGETNDLRKDAALRARLTTLMNAQRRSLRLVEVKPE